MSHITGIGGIFFQARDPEALRAWYIKHLELDVAEWGGSKMPWKEPGSTTWAVFPADTDYFSPGTASFMINFRVQDLAGLVAKLKAAGIEAPEPQDVPELGFYSWVVDPEGNKIELWEPAPGR